MPLHVLLLYFGWEAPIAHLPWIMKPTGNENYLNVTDKLGLLSAFPLLDWKPKKASSGYREKGFFPEGMLTSWLYWDGMTGTERNIFF
jgi:glutamyl-tRNA synthetase